MRECQELGLVPLVGRGGCSYKHAVGQLWTSSLHRGHQRIVAELLLCPRKVLAEPEPAVSQLNIHLGRSRNL